MGIFNGFFKNIIIEENPMPGHGIGLSDILSSVEKLDTIFSDVKTEGKKNGYERAAREYQAAFDKVCEEYKNAIDIAREDILNNQEKLNRLLMMLADLKEKKAHLEKIIREKANKVSDKYDIPFDTVKGACFSEIISTPDNTGCVIDLIYRIRNYQMEEAEKNGYIEARNTYIRKIKEMEDNLAAVIQKNDSELKELMQNISYALSEISQKEQQIAELEIALLN